VVKRTITFDKWLKSLKDKRVKNMITSRLRYVALGNFGDHKSLGDNLYELRLHYGPGYRIYFTKIDNQVVVVLCGDIKGTKRNQQSDINYAKQLVKNLEVELWKK